MKQEGENGNSNDDDDDNDNAFISFLGSNREGEVVGANLSPPVPVEQREPEEGECLLHTLIPPLNKPLVTFDRQQQFPRH